MVGVNAILDNITTEAEPVPQAPPVGGLVNGPLPVFDKPSTVNAVKKKTFEEIKKDVIAEKAAEEKKKKAEEHKDQQRQKAEEKNGKGATEHTKGARPSTKNDHEKGKAKREEAQRKSNNPNKKKPQQQNSTE